MKGVLALGVFLAGSLLVGDALATDDPCPLPDLARSPFANGKDIPRDARIAFEWPSCRVLDVELIDASGATVETRVEAIHPVAKVRPVDPLAPEQRYELRAKDRSALLGELTFTTGNHFTPKTERSAPFVEVRGFRWLDEQHRAGMFTLAVRQPDGETLGGFVSEADDGGRAVVLARGDGEVAFDQYASAEGGVESCFVVAYENAAGEPSRRRGRACMTPTGDASDVNQASGCAVGASRSGGAPIGALAAIGLALLRRRRVR